jgi:hypothetical protein
VVEAFFWGAIGAAALLIGALIAYFLNPSRQVMAVAGVAAMVLLGALVFTAGNWLLDRYAGAARKDPTDPSRMLRPWRLSWDRYWTAFRSHSYWV